MLPEDVDALVIMSFGGPEGPGEIMGFLRRVTAGRGIPDARLEQVAGQYRHFGGVSPINEENRALVRRLEEAAPSGWKGARVYLGNRNSEPFIGDTLRQMQSDGVRTAAVFITSAFSSYSGCRQYRENLAEGLAESGAAIDLRVLPRFHDHPLLTKIWARRLAAALAPARAGVGRAAGRTRVVFVTHSLPLASSARYAQQHLELAEAIMAVVEAGTAGVPGAVSGTAPEWVMAYQSRSGPPSQPWLEPDIGETVAEAAAAGVERLIVAPIGFLADNLEIRWDLDVTAGALAAEHGIEMVRLEPPQADPSFPDLVWDLLASGDGAPCRADCCPNPRGPRDAVGERA